MRPDAGAILADLVEKIYANLDLRDVLQAVTDAGSELAQAQFGAFFYNATDEHGNSYRLHVLSGAPMEKFAHLPAPRITALFAPTFHGEDLVRSDDIATDPRFVGMPRGHLPLRSYLAVPVNSRSGEVIGALLFGHSEPGIFGEAAEKSVTQIAVHAAAAIENARLFEAEQAARHDAEQAARRLTILQDVTSRLAAARVPADTADAVLDTLHGPLGADRIAIYLPAGDRFAVLYGSRGAGGPVSPQLSGLPYEWASPIADSYRQWVPVMARTSEELTQRYPDLAATVTGVETIFSLPLVTRGRAVGTLTMTWASEHELPQADIDLLATIADHVASALERTRLYEAEALAQTQLREYAEQVTEASLTLQRSLLPRALATHAQLAVAVRYVPAAAGAEVGGDWYDAVPTPDGGIAYVIGDVEGHSMSAAALMGQLRIALRAYLAEGHAAEVAIGRVNRLFLSLTDDILATCCLVKVDPVNGQAQVIRAGHHAPVVVTAAGAVVEFDDVGGVPLGVGPDVIWEPETLALNPGDRVLLYTDGLVERRERDISVGIGELAQYAHAARDETVEAAADYILERLGNRHADDVALLIFDYQGPETTPEKAVIDLAGIEDVRRARRLTKECLTRWDLGALEDSVTLVVSEMVTNALIHTPGPAAMELVRMADGVQVSVHDTEAAEPRPRPSGEDALSGRGLLIVDALAAEWGVEPAGAGKRVWAKVVA